MHREKIFIGCCLVEKQTVLNSIFLVKPDIESSPFCFSLLKKNGTAEVYSGFTCWSKYSWVYCQSPSNFRDPLSYTSDKSNSGRVLFIVYGTTSTLTPLSEWHLKLTTSTYSSHSLFTPSYRRGSGITLMSCLSVGESSLRSLLRSLPDQRCWDSNRFELIFDRLRISLQIGKRIAGEHVYFWINVFTLSLHYDSF